MMMYCFNLLIRKNKIYFNNYQNLFFVFTLLKAP